MFPGFDLLHFIAVTSIFGVAAIIFAETGLLIGFFLPGDSLLFATGFLINSGVLHFNIYAAIFILFLAAVVGNMVGYAIGKRAGPRLFGKNDARIFKKSYIARAHSFYARHGAAAIILARFIPVVRTFATVIAGAAKMNYRMFLIYNLIGGFLWTAGVTSAGYFLGHWFRILGIGIDEILFPLVLIIIVVSILPPAIHLLRNKTRRYAICESTKQRARQLFSKYPR